MVDIIPLDDPVWHDVDQELQRSQTQDCPRPLPRKRPRALTLPLSAPRRIGFRRRKQITGRQQAQSPLFRLPFELRQLVYQHALFAAEPVLGPGLDSVIISVFARRKKLGHICGRARDWSPKYYAHLEPCVCADHAQRGFLALLCTCREIYTEAIHTLYSLPTFLFQDPHDLFHFTRTTLPARLAAIRSLEVVWDGAARRYLPHRRLTSDPSFERQAWIDAWGAVAEYMTGLRDVSVRIRVGGLLHVMRDAEGIVRPLRQVLARGGGDGDEGASASVRVRLVVPAREHRRWKNGGGNGSGRGGSSDFELVEETAPNEEPWFFTDHLNLH